MAYKVLDIFGNYSVLVDEFDFSWSTVIANSYGAYGLPNMWRSDGDSGSEKRITTASGLPAAYYLYTYGEYFVEDGIRYYLSRIEAHTLTSKTYAAIAWTYADSSNANVRYLVCSLNSAFYDCTAITTPPAFTGTLPNRLDVEYCVERNIACIPFDIQGGYYNSDYTLTSVRALNDKVGWIMDGAWGSDTLTTVPHQLPKYTLSGVGAYTGSKLVIGDIWDGPLNLHRVVDAWTSLLSGRDVLDTVLFELSMSMNSWAKSVTITQPYVDFISLQTSRWYTSNPIDVNDPFIVGGFTGLSSSDNTIISVPGGSLRFSGTMFMGCFDNCFGYETTKVTFASGTSHAVYIDTEFLDELPYGLTDCFSVLSSSTAFTLVPTVDNLSVVKSIAKASSTKVTIDPYEISDDNYVYSRIDLGETLTYKRPVTVDTSTVTDGYRVYSKHHELGNDHPLCNDQFLKQVEIGGTVRNVRSLKGTFAMCRLGSSVDFSGMPYLEDVTACFMQAYGYHGNKITVMKDQQYADGVICDSLFRSADTLTEVGFPLNMGSVMYACEGCHNLKKVELTKANYTPQLAVKYGAMEGAFQNCTNLVLPSSPSEFVIPYAPSARMFHGCSETTGSVMLYPVSGSDLLPNSMACTELLESGDMFDNSRWDYLYVVPDETDALKNNTLDEHWSKCCARYDTVIYRMDGLWKPSIESVTATRVSGNGSTAYAEEGTWCLVEVVADVYEKDLPTGLGYHLMDTGTMSLYVDGNLLKTVSSPYKNVTVDNNQFRWTYRTWFQLQVGSSVKVGAEVEIKSGHTSTAKVIRTDVTPHIYTILPGLFKLIQIRHGADSQENTQMAIGTLATKDGLEVALKTRIDEHLAIRNRDTLPFFWFDSSQEDFVPPITPCVAFDTATKRLYRYYEE